MAKHTVQEKSEFYVLCLKRANSGEFNYWGSKGFTGFGSDLSQATHYKDLRSANSKRNLAKRIRDKWYDKNDEVFTGKATAVVTIEEV